METPREAALPSAPRQRVRLAARALRAGAWRVGLRQQGLPGRGSPGASGHGTRPQGTSGRDPRNRAPRAAARRWWRFVSAAPHPRAPRPVRPPARSPSRTPARPCTERRCSPSRWPRGSGCPLQHSQEGRSARAAGHHRLRRSLRPQARGLSGAGRPGAPRRCRQSRRSWGSARGSLCRSTAAPFWARACTPGRRAGPLHKARGRQAQACPAGRASCRARRPGRGARCPRRRAASRDRRGQSHCRPAPPELGRRAQSWCPSCAKARAGRPPERCSRAPPHFAPIPASPAGTRCRP
mmetsp:Transcript_85731/g.255555  ORF Transcript_85731/g.255555 Transcript_85731/m.255555 type:complete len:295 (-) Transcript_85731:383-1267(-)